MPNRESARRDFVRARQNFWLGVWRVTDPKVTLASVASMVVGACAASFHGPIHAGWLGLTVVGIFTIEAAKNASGEIFDFDSGADQAVASADRSPFSGGKQILVDGLMTRRQAGLVAAVFYFTGFVAGFLIVVLREPRVLWIGLVGVGLAFFYHAPPFKLSYRGLGEVAVAVTYGPLICVGTYLVQRQAIDPAPLWVSAPVALLISAFLWINEFPDFNADRGAGKKTLVVRLGRRRASLAFAGIVLAAFCTLGALPLLGLPPHLLLGLAGLPFGIAASHRLWMYPEQTDRIVPAQAWTLLCFLLTALGIGAGFVLAR